MGWPAPGVAERSDRPQEPVGRPTPFPRRWKAYLWKTGSPSARSKPTRDARMARKSAQPWTMLVRHALPERIIEARWETIHDPPGASS
jgi:hypothetical protein